MQSLLMEIVSAVEEARMKHPRTAPLPDGTGGSGRETWMTIARNACDRADREGRLTYTYILDEEASEAMAETDKKKLRKELLQTIAVCVRWIQDLDVQEVRKIVSGE